MIGESAVQLFNQLSIEIEPDAKKQAIADPWSERPAAGAGAD
jgi:hypothetical protein